MVKIKICGLTTLQEIEYANALRPDFIGFVFASSKRQVSPDTAARLKAALSPDIQAVGVFVNADLQTIRELCESNTIGLVQLHGDEDNHYLQALKQLVPNPVIRAVRVKGEDTVQNSLSIPADYMLFDTYQPGAYGGTGQPLDWKLLAGYPRPFFLAGGLSTENLREAIAACSPWCADVSGGAEVNGKKDKDRMRRIIEIARSVK